MKQTILVVLAALLFAALACGDGTAPSSSPTTTHRVTYEVDGTACGVSVTQENDQGGTEQGEYNLPYRVNFDMQDGDFAYISAQNMCESGSVTCRILVDSEEWKKSTSEGSYVIATCSGSVGRE